MKPGKIFFIVILVIGLICSSLVSAEEFISLKDSQTGKDLYLNGEKIRLPKKAEEKSEEFRGVWISTVYNLDFPSAQGLDEKSFKKEYRQLLNNLEDLNINSVIFQVRPSGDAFYKSEINPWSKYLTGTQGKNPGWDPLPWLIEETHNRGMEFQAWLNPYRVSSSYSSETKAKELNKLSRDNWARNNPEDVFFYEGRLYLNPASKNVQEHIVETVMELVYKYDIDGIHLDDYFYPAKDKLESFYGPEEKKEFQASALDISKIGDWRRENVNKLVRDIGHALKLYNSNHNTSIEFGISPFGIWRHKDIDKTGSNTPVGSLASYDRQFVDSKKWVEEAWIDYIAPQIYWSFDTKAAPYGELVDWWADTVKGTGVRLYIGHANYKAADPKASGGWKNPREISNQMKFNGLYDQVQGSIFFRYKNLLENPNSQQNNKFLKILKSEHYASKAKLPYSEANQNRPREIKGPYNVKNYRKFNSRELVWMDLEDNPADHYLIYRESLEGNKITERKLIKKLERRGRNYFSQTINEEAGHNYRYGLVAVSKDGRKSEITYR